ncbi:hypothetical protein EXIGLDRAFT_720300 [Exidia glandulosa HHB12029]|uniref:(4-O-methyl)-D-glucuronate--lignin esterase n=1 Tax=Exidia glandulosa HHB12029 TaxID=1314781 RepID=A0A165GHI3_EXIGL|nr:hypothetical protein EXIGLDRAFT_720300 [Exidia glandulosa HHB12029]
MQALFALVALLPAFVAAQSQVWGQCGGIGWNGPTTCVSGSVCTKQNCIPGTAPPASSSSTTSTTVPPTTTTAPPTSTGSPTTSPTSTATTTPPGPGTCPATPATVTYSNSKLPDPFGFIAGGRAATKADFACRQAEISTLFQRYELGTIPGKPQSVTASLSGNTLTINVSDQGKSISFTASISKPSGTGPFPAIIAYAAPSIPIPAGVATINFNNDDIAAQQDGSSRGKGKFFTLYGSGHSAGAMAAWAWGVSRIVDALELVQANSGIDVKRLGVTGCSRNGKGAFIAGAFEPRIALTIPQESGSGGSACWRLSDAMRTQGKDVQTASEIVGENVWFSTNFNQFSTSVPKLSVDHHELAALVAPRGLFVIENTSMEWLGNEATNGCMRAGQKVYQALGKPDAMGFSQVGNHNHCQFPSSQQADLNAFIGKFLLNQSTNTNIMKTDGSFTFNEAQWIDWTTPTLS